MTDDEYRRHKKREEKMQSLRLMASNASLTPGEREAACLALERLSRVESHPKHAVKPTPPKSPHMTGAKTTTASTGMAANFWADLSDSFRKASEDPNNWVNLDNWPTWEDPTKDAPPDGPRRAQTKGRLKQRKAPNSLMGEGGIGLPLDLVVLTSIRSRRAIRRVPRKIRRSSSVGVDQAKFPVKVAISSCASREGVAQAINAALGAAGEVAGERGRPG